MQTITLISVETIEIPPNHEMMVQGRPSKPLVTSDHGLVEPYERGVPQLKGLCVARAVVTQGDFITHKINPGLLSGEQHWPR